MSTAVEVPNLTPPVNGIVPGAEDVCAASLVGADCTFKLAISFAISSVCSFIITLNCLTNSPNISALSDISSDGVVRSSAASGPGSVIMSSSQSSGSTG